MASVRFHDKLLLPDRTFLSSLAAAFRGRVLGFAGLEAGSSTPLMTRNFT